MTGLLESYRNRSLTLGTMLMDRSVEPMPALAKAGFSFVIPDLMYGIADWNDVHHMCLAARQSEITCLIRTQSYPWGAAGPQSMVADASRAMALGADGVMLSVSSAEEVRQVAKIAGDWHRTPMLQTSVAELQELEASIKDEFVLMPLIESRGALEDLEEIICIDEVNAVMMSGTDLPRQLGIPFGYEHPRVWEYLDRAVALGQREGVAIGINTGYIFTTVDEVSARIDRIAEHGVDFVHVQTVAHMVYSYASELTSRMNPRDVEKDIHE